jgi:His/Glu/Gln/Arg/opine family amino acid ABC transporter permease subunit
MIFDFSIYVSYWPLILRGLLLTIAASGIALVLSLIIGAVIVLARLSRNRLAVYAAMAFVEVMRDLPFMVVLFLIFYLLPAFGIRLPAFAVGVITLSLYAAAYFSEIMRGAIQSVPKGQMESARATGMSRTQALRRVIAPQMMGYFLPAATNQAVTIVKESSMLSTITVTELTMVSQVIQGYTYSPIEVFALVSVLYWLMCTGVARMGRKLEAMLQLRLRPATRAL